MEESGNANGSSVRAPARASAEVNGVRAGCTRRRSRDVAGTTGPRVRGMVVRRDDPRIAHESRTEHMGAGAAPRRVQRMAVDGLFDAQRRDCASRRENDRAVALLQRLPEPLLRRFCWRWWSCVVGLRAVAAHHFGSEAARLESRLRRDGSRRLSRTLAKRVGVSSRSGFESPLSPPSAITDRALAARPPSPARRTSPAPPATRARTRLRCARGRAAGSPNMWRRVPSRRSGGKSASPLGRLMMAGGGARSPRATCPRRRHSRYRARRPERLCRYAEPWDAGRDIERAI